MIRVKKNSQKRTSFGNAGYHDASNTPWSTTRAYATWPQKKGPTKSMVMFHLDLTLPRMNSSPLKVGRLPQKERIVSQPSIFRGHLSFYIVSRSVAPHLLVGGHGFLHFETDTLHDHGIFLVEFQREISW